MKRYEFYTLDVFTDKRFTGNSLAVFPDASNIHSDEMQTIARELNLSETVFVLDSEKAAKRLRIFTPFRELPLAGHPVIGTWNLLSTLGVAPHTENGTVEVMQELKAGVLPVYLTYDGGDIVNVEMEQAAFEVRTRIEEREARKAMAAALGLGENDIGNSKTSLCQVVSTGIGSLAVPVRSLEVLKKCRVQPGPLSDIYQSSGAVGCYAFCFETFDSGSLVHARFFAPADGIPEDPATGSAAGSLSGYLVHNGIIEEREFVIEQGDIMGRPSRINARVVGEEGEVRSVKIGGKSVLMMHGTLSVD